MQECMLQDTPDNIMSMQKTIKKEVHFSGKALQTGFPAKVVCRPAEDNTGILFKRTDQDTNDVLNLREAVFSDKNNRRSTIGTGPGAVQTVEHFLAALWGLGIDNLMVEVAGEELPAMDGSALGFLTPLKEAGFTEQTTPREVIKILETETVETEKGSITIMPGEIFEVSYFIDYNIPSIGQEEFNIQLDGESFEKEIAPARTFCLKQEAEALLKAGLGQGATYENTLVLDVDGPIETTLRFPNEPVRHKVLDLVGDLYMLGCPIIGKVVAKKSGHDLNAMMLRKIYDKYITKK